MQAIPNTEIIKISTPSAEIGLSISKTPIPTNIASAHINRKTTKNFRNFHDGFVFATLCSNSFLLFRLGFNTVFFILITAFFIFNPS